MAIRQEQVVFALAVVLCGGLVLMAKGPITRRAVRTTHLEHEAKIVPEAARALPRAQATAPVLRDLFTEPTNARPMPRLAFQAPLLGPLSALAPRTVPGPRVG
ncbi:MAG: hypothetical protein H8D72_00360, partial [Planctomycetes bacterium]|nr:hypothetical protein [Planctomycetota bacterium]